MPSRPSRVKKTTATDDATPVQAHEEPRRTVTLPRFPKVPMPKTWTPVLMVLLLVASFLIGMLYTKVQFLEGNGSAAPSAPTAGTQQAGGTQVTPGAKITDVAKGAFAPLGNPNAKVTVIEYADYQCPFCEQWYSTVWPSLKKDYVDTGKIAFYFNNYPFLGQESTWAAEAAYCANDQGKFWDWHDYLYTHQGQENSGAFSKANLEQFASNMGMDTSKFNNCLDTDQYSKQVASDLADGQKATVNGTPTVFINGTPVVGAQPYSAFQTVIDQELAK